MHTQTMINRNSFPPLAACGPRRAAGDARTLAMSIELMGAVMPFARNAEIYGENEPAEYLYKVVSGAVRTYKVLNDGRRQIGAFYLPGDVFGLEIGRRSTFSAEAISECKVMVIKRSRAGRAGLPRQRRRQPALDHDRRRNCSARRTTSCC